jgi:hypothetical protein
VAAMFNFLDSSPLKPFGQMNRNLVGSIYGKTFVTIAHFRPDPLRNMAARQFLILIGIACGGHVC